MTPTTVPSIVHEVLHSPSKPLDSTTRAYMEPRFSHDFSQVCVHTDEKAALSARAVHARAYTVSQNIVFDAKQYAPENASGRQLLAHELTHVVQQTNDSFDNYLQRSERVEVSSTRCSNTQTRNVARAIPGAEKMTWTALTWMISFNPRNRTRIDDLLRKNFRSDTESTFDTVKSRLMSIYSYLGQARSGNLPFDCAPVTDRECTNRSGYVRRGESMIHICPSFYGGTLEERRWFLIHECAHLAGARGAPEVYHAYFGTVPCDQSTPVPSSRSALENADNYARFVWCLTRRPDVQITPP